MSDLQLTRAEEWKPNRKSLAKIDAIKQQYRIEGRMTLRRAYYVLVGKGMIRNSRSSYIQLSKLFKQARIHGFLPFACIEDTARNVYKRATSSSFQEAFDELVFDFRKDSMQEQACNVEVWIEKEAIANIIYGVTYDLDVPLVVSKGFTSVTFKKNSADRIKEAWSEGKKTVVLFVSDFDAEGEYIPQVLKNDLIQDYDCDPDSFQIKKVLLNHADVQQHSLISNVDYRIKPEQRKKAYVQRFTAAYDDVQYELDALPTNVLKDKVKQAIAQHIDLSIAENSDRLSREEVDRWLEKQRGTST